MTRDEEIAELRTMRIAIENRLSELSSEVAGA